ncbi:MAG: hypothetical protein U0Z53_25305 [Blastocatellia bacterium]
MRSKTPEYVKWIMLAVFELTLLLLFILLCLLISNRATSSSVRSGRPVAAVSPVRFRE